MEFQGTFLDYVRHATLTRLQNRISTVKTLIMPGNQRYSFYNASGGRLSVEGEYTDWTLTAPDAMFLFRDIETMSVGSFLSALTAYLQNNPVFCWEEIVPSLGASSALSRLNEAVQGSVTLITSAGSYAGTTAPLTAPGTFADLIAWLAALCSGSAAGAPMSEVLTETEVGRRCLLTLRGNVDTLRFTLDFPPYVAVEEPWYNAGTGLGYASLGEALTDASAGDTLWLRCDYAVTAADADGHSTVTIPTGVMLAIPSSGTLNDTVSGNNAFSRLMGGAAWATLQLGNYVLDVQGTLLVAGNQQAWYVDTGRRSGNYGAVELDRDGTILVSGEMYGRGRVYGVGGIYVESGGKLYELMEVLDWRGGNETIESYSSDKIWPFSHYSLSGIECEIFSHANSKLYGQLFLYAGGMGQETSVPIVGPEGLFRPGTNGLIELKREEDYTVFEFGGSCSTADLGFSAFNGFASIDSKGMELPLWHIRLIVHGLLEIPNRLKMLPGSGITVKGTLLLGKMGALYFYRASEYSGDYYHHYDYDPVPEEADAALCLDGGSLELEEGQSGTADLAMTQTSNPSTSTLRRYSWSLGTSSASVTGNRTDNLHDGSSQTLTLTAAADGYLSFDFSLPTDTRISIGRESYYASGSYREELWAGDAVNVTVRFIMGSGSSRTVMLNNIVQTLATEGKIGSSDASLRNLPAGFTSVSTASIREYEQGRGPVAAAMYLAQDES